METNPAAGRLQLLLGKYIRVRVTHPMGSVLSEEDGTQYELNCGEPLWHFPGGQRPERAYIVGIHHPIRNFDGRVIALIFPRDGGGQVVVAPKKSRHIESQIRQAIRFAYPPGTCRLICLYERSCGAVVYRRINSEIRFLLIKNRRSAHWGFPKGHVEDGESGEQTAQREVLEETGLHIRLLPEFSSQSEYTIQGKVEKSVTIFLGETLDKQTVIQQEEIEDYIWLSYDKAMHTLRFENDRNILRKACHFMQRKGIQ
ncbi:MAG: NUDIX domain-containing protein [Oscillospiraceae bacterium]|jgi:8-oxo-dGTP pyrophosphatase MutT (NUDIX family)|nr:NUDIX domain-containing protein [Oscillospiraceae bacterium]